MKTCQTRNLLKIILWPLLAYSMCFNARSQPAPRLSITNISPALAEISWTNTVGKSYRLLSTPALGTSSLKPLEDAFSGDPKVTVSISKALSPAQFFRLMIPTNGTLPAVQIFSPTNNQTVSGEIAVGVGAQITNQLQGVNLYLDDALVGYVNSGGIKFDLDTTHFVNGTHTLYASAVDTANNEIASSTLTLDFENSVRWLDACSMFNSYVPINVDSDIYPADWLVTVTDTNGIIVRTITGSTTDGIIQTIWDGTDDNSQTLPVENLYEITVDVAESEGSMMSMSSLPGNSGLTSVTSKVNRYGVIEFETQQPAPNPMVAYLEMVKTYKQLSKKERLIYPPLPLQPVDSPAVVARKKMDAREMFFASHHLATAGTPSTSGTFTATASSTARNGTTKTLSWWENSWSSAQTVVARVPISGSMNTKVINLCNQIAILIGAADGTVGNNRGVYGENVQVVSASSDVTQLKNNLNDSNVRALYFYGHGTTNGNAFGTTTTGIFATNLAALFGNHYYSSLPPRWGTYAGKRSMVTLKPFSFVFLDGCNTALGDLPEAFGIPKAVPGSDLIDAGLHRRAFMGWTAPVIFQFDPDHIDWTLKFWSVWLDGNAYDTTLSFAREAADSYRPSVVNNVPIKIYGNKSLKWSN